jgi:soluble lytic murein transglycosylase-like protein
MKILFLCALALPLFAAENAILSSGLRLRVERHETVNGIVRLHTAGGVIELPESAIVAFEAEEYVAPPPALAPAVVVASAATPDVAMKPATPQELIEDAAIKAGLPPAIVHSVAKAESGYRPGAISPKGAIGLMQLMPGTAAELNADPHDPRQNAEAGARYLRELLIKYDGDVPKALAAYNAGPGAVAKYNGVPPYSETRSYVNRVIRDYKKRSGITD